MLSLITAASANATTTIDTSNATTHTSIITTSISNLTTAPSTTTTIPSLIFLTHPTHMPKLKKSGKHYVYPPVHIVTNNNSLFSHSIGHFDFNTSIYSDSTYKLCPAYLPAHSCQTLALNSEQTTLRAHYHTQLENRTPLQWFQDALTTRSISIIDTQHCEPSTTTNKIINKSSYSQPIQNIDPFVTHVYKEQISMSFPLWKN